MFKYKKISDEKITKTCINRNTNAKYKNIIDGAIDFTNINGVHIDSAKKDRSIVNYKLKIDRNMVDIDKLLKESERYNIISYTFYKDDTEDNIFLEIINK
ncbi:hypothetical protein [Clostridium sp. BJN0001]|uniref:hypothetical protein n=1 Tax=Clostridium sp. BJN0001 TaxID=2930219 RepID=UPI001FD0F810|nr:hypothetical protein [Clostridium sp. BJN0001]